jgi:hypothetical protein
MEGGFTTDALVDMTAGVDEAFEIFQLDDEKAKPPGFKERIKGILYQGYLKKSMLGTSINGDGPGKEGHVDNGLITGID